MARLPIKCDVCGRFVALEKLLDGSAIHRILTPDSHFSREEWETLCQNHNEKTNRMEGEE